MFFGTSKEHHCSSILCPFCFHSFRILLCENHNFESHQNSQVLPGISMMRLILKDDRLFYLRNNHLPVCEKSLTPNKKGQSK